MPLEQLGNAVIFYAHYVKSGVSVTGLDVTADVWEIQTDGTATEIASAQAAAEIGDGLYRYRVAGASIDVEGEYLCVFKTAGDVDQKHVAAIWVINRAGIENLDAPLTTIDSNVDAILVDTNELQTDDYPTSIAAVQTTVDAIEADTQDLQTQVGVDGAGLTALGDPRIVNLDAAVSTLGTAVDLAAVKAETAEIVADTAEVQAELADGGRTDLLIDAILADTGTDGVAIAAEILKRGIANVEDAADATSLAALVLAAFEASITGTTLTIRKTDGTTFTTKIVTLDATAVPIVGIT